MNGIFLFIFYQFINSIINTFIIRKPKITVLKRLPKVSVLVPARNEENNIARCVSSLLLQDYPDYEVIVLNDNSTDETYNTLLSIKDERLKIIDSNIVLPEGWTGKNWACYQLYLNSSGEILIFTDADTYHSKDMILIMVQEMEGRNLDFISGIPREEVITFGEKVTVPFINYSIFSIFPVYLSYLVRFLYFFMFANGQFMMFKREAYERINGHAAVKGEVTEDIELSKIARKNGLRVSIYNLVDLVSCRMYRNFKEAFWGLSKSYFPLFQMRLIPSLFIWVWILTINFGPFYSILRYKDLSFSSISIIETFVIWLILSIKFKLPLDIPLYYPIISAINSIIGFSSVVLGLMGRSSWKGRRLGNKRIRIS